MEKVTDLPRPQVKVIYNGKDITNDISKNIVGFKYVDNSEGASDSIDLKLEDTDENWRNGWYPNKGDDVTVSLGYNGTLLDCGVFEIDQIQLSGPPDNVSLQGLGAGIKGNLRTKVSTAHENKTLRQIADTIARKHKLTVIGSITPIVIERVTQREETDLAFLNRIGSEYGFTFNVRGNKLIFMSMFDIEERPAVTVVDKTDLLSWDITDKTLQTYSKVVVKYHNPVNKEVSTFETVPNNDNIPFNFIKTEDVLTIHTKAENNQQAQAKAKAAIYRANSLQQEGSITLPGRAVLVAGNNFELTGLGKISGIFHIMSSEHDVNRSGGWTTTLQIKRVGFVVKTKEKSTKKRKPAKYTTTIVK
jgi:phage protein D